MEQYDRITRRAVRFPDPLSRVFTVFVGENVFSLKDRGIEACAAVGGEAVFNDGFYVVAEDHGVPTRPLQSFILTNH